MTVGGIPLPVFSEWWLTMEMFSSIDSFIQSSFPGATFQGCNGLSAKYQVLPVSKLLYIVPFFKLHVNQSLESTFLNSFAVRYVLTLLDRKIACSYIWLVKKVGMVDSFAQNLTV